MRPWLRAAVWLAVVAAIVVVLVRPLPREAITVEAIGTVPLYDPATMAGQFGVAPTLVGTLQPGEVTRVVGCNPRKSDIDLEVSFQSRRAVVGGGSGDYRLTRREAKGGESGGTNSCRGLF